ncbi:uncharacterized protein TNCV_4960741 [Trichonephila clavipes]|uniref:Uncharacterized protein n=1 Tax=Trichonephila clavipes TaxID=2585209 RepID=A0A8X6VMY5_TRICX|nr:uncharacterized protein TNCV_4960741 [Trichonephila clavipes]
MLGATAPVSRVFARAVSTFHRLVETTRGLLATDHVILNHGQVTWTTPELAPPLLTTTPHQREDVSALDRFNVHRCPTRRVFSGTGLEPVTKASHSPIPIPLGYRGHNRKVAHLRGVKPALTAPALIEERHRSFRLPLAWHSCMRRASDQSALPPRVSEGGLEFVTAVYRLGCLQQNRASHVRP